MEGILGEVRQTAEMIFLGGDWTYLAMVAAAILIGVFAMRNVGQILCVSVLGLVMLGIIWIVYNGATSATPSDPQVWMGELESGWAAMGATNGTTLISYLIVFAVAIGVLFVAKSLLFRE